MQLTEIVKAAGIVGNGGAGFPTHVKMNTQVEYFIINAAECEPLIETDKYLIRHFTEKLIWGIELIADHLGASYKYIALKGKYKEEIECLKEVITRLGSTIQIFEMSSFYPAGDEQVIVYEVTGRVVPERGIPLDVGVVINNVGTVIQIYEALEEDKPSTHKYLSIGGEVKNKKILKVPIGTSIKTCIEAVEPLLDHYSILIGGPMMGKIYKDKGQIKDLVVTKTDGNIFLLPQDHYLVTQSQLTLKQLAKRAKSSCIQCQLCTQLCPRKELGHSVYPHQVMRNLYREGEIEDTEEYIKAFGTAVNCSECGICEIYACPMMLAPRQVNRYLKKQIREKHLDIPKYFPKPVDHEREYKKIPTDRLIYRLGLGPYYDYTKVNELLELHPQKVNIPLKQHIGVPAEPVVKEGDMVNVGDLIAKVEEGKLGAHIHASLSGIVVCINESITIWGKE